jgi:hypothetical protein
MEINNIEDLDKKMASCWKDILSRPLAAEFQKILLSGDKKLYAMWLCQVAHLTKHTSAHQALVGIRVNNTSYPYAKFCYEHACEEVGHEMMAVNDLKKIGVKATKVDDLPPPLPATVKLTAFLYHISEREHPATRLGFSYWAEKCYPFIHTLARGTQKALGLGDNQMTFFVSHAVIDEKHAKDVERIVKIVCKTPEDWEAVTNGMVDTLEMAINIFVEIYHLVHTSEGTNHYTALLSSLKE